MSRRTLAVLATVVVSLQLLHLGTVVDPLTAFYTAAVVVTTYFTGRIHEMAVTTEDVRLLRESLQRLEEKVKQL